MAKPSLADLQRQIQELQYQLNEKKVSVNTSSGGLPEFKHLNGENYNEWKFLMKNFLIDAGLWQCVESNSQNEITHDLDQRALAKINLSIKPNASAETRKAKTAKEAWEALRNIYEDKGIVRRIGLYSALFKTRYDEFSSMSDYIEHVTSIADQLDSIGKPLDNETVGGIILGGLPETFRPLILGIQGSNQDISVEFVKNLLLQDNVKDLSCKPQQSNENAFHSKLKKRYSSHNPKRREPRCYNCNKTGHYSSQCDKATKSEPKYRNKIPEKPSNFFTCNSSNPPKPNDWYLDSGCNAHMTPREDWIENISPQSNRSIDVANGNSVAANGVGDVTIPLLTNRKVNVESVIHAPELTANLLSVSQIAKKGNTIIFDSQGCRISTKKVYIPKGEVIATASEDRGLYKLDVQKNTASSAILNCHDIWHRRLAHLNRRDMKILQYMSTGMNPGRDPKVPCISCVKGKQHRSKFPESTFRANKILHLIHSDLCGPMQTPSVGGAKYFLTFIDDYSRKSFVYFLKSKDEVTQTFKEFKSFVENQTDNRIKMIRTDNGREYVNHELEKVFKDSGIHHQLTVPNTPEQNGVAERLNRTLVEKARTMLIDSGLSVKLWAEAVNTANYLRNRSPTKALKTMTPEEAFTGIKPNLSNLKIFGCKALVHIPKSQRKKWDPKSDERYFVGYSQNSKGYRVIHPFTLKVSIARDIVFCENEFINETGPSSKPEDAEMVATAKTQTSKEDDIDHNSSNEDADEHVSQEEMLKASTSIVNDESWYQANQCEEPKSYEEACNRADSSEWKKAMEDEVESHKKNESWEYCNLPPGKHAIKSRWTFRIKHRSDGEIDKYKARLVAKGCSQKYGIDYEETFSPTVRHSSIRFLLSLAAKYKLKIHQMDVETAFLHPELNEDIYMELPNNEEYFPQRYCKLKKSIYGLKQASRVWYQKLDKKLCKMGLIRSKADPCVFFKRDQETMLIVAVYVDDLLILSNNIKEKEQLKEELNQEFRMKDLGEAHFILGMRIDRDQSDGSITLDQSNYIKNMLKRFGMEDCKEVSTPMTPGQIFTKDMSPKTEDEKQAMKNIPYREAIGSLLYASQGTRPDICHAVGVLSRFSNNPGQSHWVAVKRIFRYLKGTLDKKLHYCENSESANLHGFSDSDWANDKEDRRSTTGYIFCNSGGAVSWCSKKQQTVALSTTEAEYMALSSASQELLWLTQLREEILGNKFDPIEIFCDNRGCINLSTNRVLSPRVKHIDIRHHFLREKIEMGILKIQFIDTKNNIADIFTKSVPVAKLQESILKLGLE